MNYWSWILAPWYKFSGNRRSESSRYWLLQQLDWWTSCKRYWASSHIIPLGSSPGKSKNVERIMIFLMIKSSNNHRHRICIFHVCFVRLLKIKVDGLLQKLPIGSKNTQSKYFLYFYNSFWDIFNFSYLVTWLINIIIEFIVPYLLHSEIEWNSGSHWMNPKKLPYR